MLKPEIEIIPNLQRLILYHLDPMIEFQDIVFFFKILEKHGIKVLDGSCSYTDYYDHVHCRTCRNAKNMAYIGAEEGMDFATVTCEYNKLYFHVGLHFCNKVIHFTSLYDIDIFKLIDMDSLMADIEDLSKNGWNLPEK